MTETEIQKILDSQRDFFRSGSTLDVKGRQESLARLKKGILKYERKIHEALEKDLGKSRFESYMCETGMVLSEITYMQRHLGGFARERRVPTPLAQFAARSFRKSALSLWAGADYEPLELSVSSDLGSSGRCPGGGQYCDFKAQRLFPSYQQRNKRPDRRMLPQGACGSGDRGTGGEYQPPFP